MASEGTFGVLGIVDAHDAKTWTAVFWIVRLSLKTAGSTGRATWNWLSGGGAAAVGVDAWTSCGATALARACWITSRAIHATSATAAMATR
jgi:hypothetical protein